MSLKIKTRLDRIELAEIPERMGKEFMRSPKLLAVDRNYGKNNSSL